MREFILEENRKIREQSLWRSLSVIEAATPTKAVIGQKSYLNFSSNDYLGLSRNPHVIQSAIKALHQYGSGGRSSRLISGTLDLHKNLEDRFAGFKRTESALLFPTGFMANLGVLSALLGEGDAVIMDRLNHASLIDAAKLSKCRIFVYEHCSGQSLEKVLKRTKSYKKRLVATDSLFSMDGDIAPLDKILPLCKEHGVPLMIDDAHATGILGENGIGLAEHFGLTGEIEIVMGTLSKALGSQGGIVCGSKDFIEFLINRARPFIYTTALSPASCAAAMAALELIESEPERRRRLIETSRKLKKRFLELLPGGAGMVENSAAQIVPFPVGTTEKAASLSRFLSDSGIFVPAIRPPTVGKNECRLRFSLTSDHTDREIDSVIASLSDYLHKESGI